MSGTKLQSYKVTSQLQHDGKTYQEGDTVELTDAEAKADIEHGVIDPTPIPAAPAKK